MLASFLIAVPTGMKIFNWLATLWRGTIEFKTPLLLRRGLHRHVRRSAASPAMFLAIFPVDWQLTDTYFVVAHLHYVLMGGAVFAIFAGHLLLVPEDHRAGCCPRAWARRRSGSCSSASTSTFLVQHPLGLSGMPRRVYEYSREASAWPPTT